MPTAVERIASSNWSLVGSVMIGPLDQPLSWMTYQMNLPELRRTGGSLNVIHAFGPLSSQIRDAMLKKTVLPKVGIETPHYTVTLVNAQITKVGSYHPSAIGTHSEGNDTNELEKIDLTFQKIAVTWGGGAISTKDSWKP